jgi:hypothetical protein
MGKQAAQTEPVEVKTVATRAVAIPLPALWVQAAFVALLALVFYANTIQNQYALDDTAVIVQNEYVHQGLAGIPDILTNDVYASYYSRLGSSDQLSGGRYRPLSVVTFAVEQQLLGPVAKGATDSVITYGLGLDLQEHYEQQFIRQMHVRHAVNVVLYAVLVVLLLYFFNTMVFAGQPLMALIAALLFAIHPIHTEVVANVKSRDELLSLIFILLTFICSFWYLQRNHLKWLVAALGCYCLALLSKEYAITLVFLLPLSFYVLGGQQLGKSIVKSISFWVVAGIYALIRLKMLGPRSELADNDIQINPYAWASSTEKWATEIATSLNYLKLLIFPHPLSSDYSYNQITYKDFSHPLVWLSLAVHIGLVVGFIYFLRKKHLLAFAIGFYLANLLMINNFLFDIGATMGERLIFHSSVGFVIALAWLVVKGLERLKRPALQRGLLIGALGVIVVLCGFKTIARNRDWKNDTTLFFQDINVSPNSFLVNVNVATMLVNHSDFVTDAQKRNADLKRGVQLYTRVLGMQNNYVMGYLNRCIAYYKLNNADSMVADLDRVKTLYPIHPMLPQMYYRAGELYYSQARYAPADSAMLWCLRMNPRETAAVQGLHRIDSAMRALK